MDFREGVVATFIEKPNNSFGFMNVVDEEGKTVSVFFHPAYSGTFICNGGPDPVFIHTPVQKPKRGDRVFVAYNQGEKGLRATAWAFVESFEQADSDCNKRLKYRIYYRNGFVRHSKLYSDSTAVYKVLWEGNDLVELRNRYPKTLYPVHDEDQSALTFQFYESESESWIYCQDPR